MITIVIRAFNGGNIPKEEINEEILLAETRMNGGRSKLRFHIVKIDSICEEGKTSDIARTIPKSDLKYFKKLEENAKR